MVLQVYTVKSSTDNPSALGYATMCLSILHCTDSEALHGIIARTHVTQPKVLGPIHIPLCG